MLSDTEWSTKLEEIKWQKFFCGSDGYVVLVDAMGAESAVLDAARVSYGRQGMRDSPRDVPLLRYMMRNRHTTPFEMVELKFFIRCPMDTWRQWIRNRTANVNEYSTRYSEAIDSMAITGPLEWRLQSTDNKQGSSASFVHPQRGIELSNDEVAFHRAARELYETRLAAGVAKEQARKDLPLSTYTEAYWKIDLHNLMNHFIKLRMDAHAQLEIREYATAMFNGVLLKLYPTIAAAFEDYILWAHTFSQKEMQVLFWMLRHPEDQNATYAKTVLDSYDYSEREIKQFISKLGLL